MVSSAADALFQQPCPNFHIRPDAILNKPFVIRRRSSIEMWPDGGKFFAAQHGVAESKQPS